MFLISYFSYLRVLDILNELCFEILLCAFLEENLESCLIKFVLKKLIPILIEK